MQYTLFIMFSILDIESGFCFLPVLDVFMFKDIWYEFF